MLDHGVLNVPLAKRGNIDAQLDAYKREQATSEAAKRKAASKLTAAQRIQAKALVAGMSDERIAAMAAKHSITKAAVRQMLNSAAYFTPAQIIKAEVVEVVA